MELPGPFVAVVAGYVHIYVHIHIYIYIYDGRAQMGQAPGSPPVPGLDPAHIPSWHANTLTLWDSCALVTRKTDVDLSKINVPINASLPQASYACGSFSETIR